jgi:hypothetical protein
MDSRRFTVALSFPSEHRDFVSRVADCLAEKLSKPRILYDKYHEAEFARPNLDVHLPNLYRTDSDLIAIFLCEEYKEKRWCKLEWRSVRQLISTADEDRIMFLSFDDVGAIPEIGILDGDGYVAIGERTPEEIADLILQRLRPSSRLALSSTHALHEMNTPTAGPRNDAQPHVMTDASVFYLFASPITALDESSATVFYKVNGHSLAESLCRLFTREYADNDRTIFHYRAGDGIGFDEHILFDETLDWLATYDDPDPGIYDPQPSQEMFVLAQYGVRAKKWEEILRDRASHATKTVDITPATPQPSAAMAIWREKLNFFLAEEAAAADAEQKFRLQKLIREAKAKIREHGGVP